jgi:hypothetical protein
MEAKTDIVLNLDGDLYLRIASTKKEAEAKVLAKTLVNKLTPLLKDGVTFESFIVASRFMEKGND